jgi:hypothetical protein
MSAGWGRGNAPPRPPTMAELDDLFEWEAEKLGPQATEEEGRDLIELIGDASIVVWPSYLPDTPGYTGRVMVVLWPGGVELLSVYGWNPQGQILDVGRLES